MLINNMLLSGFSIHGYKYHSISYSIPALHIKPLKKLNLSSRY